MGKTFSTGLLTNGVFQDASNNVGIGAAPSGSYKLEVTGTAKVSSTLLANGISSIGQEQALTFQRTTGSASDLYSINADSGSAYLYNNTTSKALMTWLEGGNVGIGTSNPQMPLSVQANTGNGAIRLIGTSNASSNNAGIYWYDSNDSTFNGYLGNFSGSFDIYNHRSTPMVFSTAATERMRITSGGNIEIANASSFLQWIGGSYWTFRTVTSGTEFWLYRGDTGATPLIVTSGNIVRLSSLAGSGSRTVTADASGNLSASSDSSLKQEDTNHKIEGLAEILQLKPRAYKWLSDIEIRGEEATTEIGFFADEVNPIIPSAAPMGNDGLYGFYDRAVIAALVKSVQELSKQNEELSKQNEELSNRLIKAGL